jgi:uncharacterized membrane protein YdjX (TVP38/TMEM64 family)
METTTPGSVEMPAAVKPLWRRLLLPGVILAFMVMAYVTGLHRYLSLQAIAENRKALGDFTSANLLLALLGYVAAYTAAVALSLPGASILTILGGLLFGWLVGGLAAIVAATLGAVVIFSVVKTSLGEGLAKRAGPFLARISDGFAKDAFNYLLFLRLVPAFPFWLVNIAPALANVKLRTFALATAIGIIPGTFAFAFVGEGLDSIIAAQTAAYDSCVTQNGKDACSFELSIGSLVTTELLIAFAALGVVALIPVLIKKWRGAP